MACTLSLPSTSAAVMIRSSSGVLQSVEHKNASTSSHASRAKLGSFNGLRRDGGSVTFQQGFASPKLLTYKKVHVVALAGFSGKFPSLNELPLINYINPQGRIQPQAPASTAASVFAIFDKNKKVQYIGFSKDVRNSLRTLMGRRPEYCYFYKVFNLEVLDQQQMLDVRNQWTSELGLAPLGNSDPSQRSQWEKPSDAGSISERGKVAAASSKAKTLLQIMADRGIKEQMVYDPELLAAGKCDLLPSGNQTEEELEEAAISLATAAAKRHDVVVEAPDGSIIEFEIFFEKKHKTNGGWMYDVLVSKDARETRHRVICGRIYPEAVKLPEDRFVEVVFAYLLHKKVPRRTEGLMGPEEFPINYFAVSEVAQEFPDMKDWFVGELPDSYWRFNKVHSYGPSVDPPPLLGPGTALNSYNA